MSRASTKTCASCARFPLRAAVENNGVAECGGYEKPATWSDSACVLYNAASNLSERRRMVEQLRAQSQKTQEGIHE